MYLLLALHYREIEAHIPPLTHFSTINNISVSVKRSHFALVVFRAACHANLEPERLFAGSNSYILRHIFLKFSHTSANNNVPL